MARVAALSGTAGALFLAVEAELGARGWTVRRAVAGPGARLSGLAEAARGAEALLHLGVRTPRELHEPQRAALEAAAASEAGAAARAAGVRRFVHVSTVSVYGRPRNLPCEEGEVKQPRTPFERARWRAEQAAWRTFREGAPLTVLRPALVYGPTVRRGAVRALALVEIFNAGRRRVPIIRRGPVVHLAHAEDVASAAAFLAEHPDDQAVVGRAFNVADEAPLPLGELGAAALEALGHSPGRILPWSPRLWAALIWLVRHVPDRVLLEPLNRALARAWNRIARRRDVAPVLVPRIDREVLLWMAADHYYDTRRLRELGWRPGHPLSIDAIPETVRGLASLHLLPRVHDGAAAPP
ncbi:MAG TPA: NAD(P)-dependent oxidoreductase [Anaeromyxobacteraceae bacterium]|nr:NAD(P)-dependent oxidoreductase [Anaeromyxobacteraceae bacterium]